jgi:hypothetical protein
MLLSRRAALGVAIAALTTLPAAAVAGEPGTEACIEAFETGQSAREEQDLVEARRRFLICSQEGCPAVLRRDCLSWVEQVDASFPSVVFRVVDELGRDVAAAQIYVDDELVAGRAEGWALPVAPGRRLFRAVVPGRRAVEQRAILAEGEKNRLIVFRLQPGEGDRVALTPRPAAPPEGRRPVPVIALVAGGVGLAGIGTFGVLGVTGLGQARALRDECGVSRACTQGEVDAVRTRLIIADVALAVGVAALVTAAVVALARGPSARSIR